MKESNSTGYRYIFWGLFILLAACLCFYCGRTSVKKPASNGLPSTNAGNILSADSLRSLYQAKVRAAIDSTRAAMLIRQKESKKEYGKDRAADLAAEAGYQAGTVECDSVIRTKNKTIKTGEILLARCDSLAAQDSLKLASFAETVAGKDTTISDLKRENSRILNQNPPIAVYPKIGIDKQPLYFNPEIGAVVVLPNGLMVSYSKGIVHDSHRAEIGFKLQIFRRKR